MSHNMHYVKLEECAERLKSLSSAVGQDDLDQLVIIAFLGVCRDYDLDRYDSYTIVRLRQLTQKRVELPAAGFQILHFPGPSVPIDTECRASGCC